MSKMITLDNLSRYHGKLLEHYDARVIAEAPSGGDDATYLETLFAQGRVILRPKAHYKVGRTIILPEGTDVEMNGATIEYNGPGFSNASGSENSGCLFLNVDRNSAADKLITEYNGRGNYKFRNGIFINSAFGFIHGHDITFEDVTFGEISTNGHVFQLSACKNVSFLRCTFHGVSLAQDNTYGSTANAVSTEVINLDLSSYGQFIDKWFFPSGTTTLDEYACRDISVDQCVFRPNNNSVYADAIGYHANFMQPYSDEVSPDPDKAKQFHKCIRVVNNYIYGSQRSSGNTRYTIAFKVRHMMNSIFANNVCENIQSLAVIDHIRQVTISGNVVKRNSNNANAFVVESTWHTWSTGTVIDPSGETQNMGYYTTSKYMNIAGNSYGKATITFDTSNTSIYNKSNWAANTNAKPRYSKEGATITLHGRVKPTTAITFNSEIEVMTLPEECRPTTTVAWVGKGDTYAATNVSFPVLVKITNAGVLSLTPIGNSLSLTAASDIWIDGTYVM